MRYTSILIDGSNLLHRCVHTQNLSIDLDDQLIQVGGVYGFVRACIASYDEFAEERASTTICWEGNREVCRRREMYPDYKSGRIPNPDVIAQEALLRILLRILGWRQAWIEGWEADDAIATLALGTATRTLILSSDHDLHQLVCPNIHCADPTGRSRERVWTPEGILRRDGVPPRRISEMKALIGDPSDGYPGVRGIGKKWALRILKGNADLPSLFQAIEDGEIRYEDEDGNEGVLPQRYLNALVDGRGMIAICHRLAVPHVDFDEIVYDRMGGGEGVEPALKRLKFSSLLSRSRLDLIDRIAGRFDK